MSKTQTTTSPKADVYSRVTARILADLETGVRPWMKPWSAGNTEGRITRPLRHNGTPYRGMNVLLWWGEAIERGLLELWLWFARCMPSRSEAHALAGTCSASP